MKYQLGFYVPRILAVIFVIVGIVTAALNLSFGGFTPICWFLLAIADLLYITCHEVLTIRILLESKK